PANRGACSAGNCGSASRICRQPRNWSVLVHANNTASTRSETSVKNRNSPAVNGVDASTTNINAVASAAAARANSPCDESRPPTPGVSTTDTCCNSGTGPDTLTLRGGSCPAGNSYARDTHRANYGNAMSTGANSPG